MVVKENKGTKRAGCREKLQPKRHVVENGPFIERTESEKKHQKTS